MNFPLYITVQKWAAGGKNSKLNISNEKNEKKRSRRNKYPPPFVQYPNARHGAKKCGPSTPWALDTPIFLTLCEKWCKNVRSLPGTGQGGV